MATVKHYHVVEVRWEDASIETQDFTRKDAKKNKPVIRWTTGYLVEENDDTLVLATDFYEGKKEEFASPMQIPWGMILEYYKRPLWD
jgi:hypothetical protein